MWGQPKMSWLKRRPRRPSKMFIFEACLRICRMIHATKNALKKNGSICPDAWLETNSLPNICRAFNTNGGPKQSRRKGTKWNILAKTFVNLMMYYVGSALMLMRPHPALFCVKGLFAGIVLMSGVRSTRNRWSPILRRVQKTYATDAMTLFAMMRGFHREYAGALYLRYIRRIGFLGQPV